MSAAALGLALAIGLGTSEAVAQTVISDTVTTGYTFSPNGVLTITESGRLIPALGVGVQNFDDNTVLNNFGAILATQDRAVYYEEADNSVLLNRGRIEVVENGAASGDAIFIDLSLNNEVINQGVITTSDNQATGIFSSQSNDTTITNLGAVLVSGIGSHAIVVSQSQRDGTTSVPTLGLDAEVTVQGSVLSFQGDAIRMDGEDGVLNLVAPGYLGGAIVFADNFASDAAFVEFDQTLNITTGASHSVNWTLPTTNLVGGEAIVGGQVAGFYDTATGQFVTYDPSGSSAGFGQLGDMAGQLSGLGQYGLGEAPAPGGFSAGDGGDGMLAEEYGFGSGDIWVQASGGQMTRDGEDGVTLDQELTSYGLSAGFSWQEDADTRLGFMAGVMRSEAIADSRFATSYDMESWSVFAGVQGEQTVTRGSFPITLGLALYGGWQTTESDRFINNNTATTGGMTLGIDGASASYDSWFVIPEASISADYAMAQPGVTVTPAARIRYAHQAVSGYTETGASGATSMAANATVEDHTLGLLEGELELAITKELTDTLTLTGLAGYQMRTSTGDDSVEVTLIGITEDVALGDGDSSGAYVGAGLDLALNDRASLQIQGRAHITGDITGATGTARLTVGF